MKQLRWIALPLLTLIALTTSLSRGSYQDDFPLRWKKIERAHQVPERQWGLRQTATTDAWRLSQGDRQLIVAVIDTGVDTEHPDLKENLWLNPGESGQDENGRDRASNGVDDDGNGYIDDVRGWNFVGSNNDVTDHHGHGTHIAGIIGARGRIQGLAPQVQLMTLKYFDPKENPQQNPLANTVLALRYAVRMGADVINYSGGGMAPNSAEYAALLEAERRGILVVAAAGNERANADEKAFYPASYDLSNILSVTATDANERILNSSNWGESSVDIAAPGRDILSTLPNGTYGLMSGTSQATAFATGIAVLLKAHRAELKTPKALIDHLLRTGAFDPQLIGRTRSRAILNTYRALAMHQSGTDAFGNPVATDSGDQRDFIIQESR